MWLSRGIGRSRAAGRWAHMAVCRLNAVAWLTSGRCQRGADLAGRAALHTKSREGRYLSLTGGKGPIVWGRAGVVRGAHAPHAPGGGISVWGRAFPWRAGI